jgi:hypothetical protein
METNLSNHSLPATRACQISRNAAFLCTACSTDPARRLCQSRYQSFMLTYCLVISYHGSCITMDLSNRSVPATAACRLRDSVATCHMVQEIRCRRYAHSSRMTLPLGTSSLRLPLPRSEAGTLVAVCKTNRLVPATKACH